MSKKVFAWLSRHGWVMVLSATALLVVVEVASMIASRVPRPEPGTLAPALELPRLDRTGPGSLEALRGKVVVLDFWASWCKPCEFEMPILKEIDAHFPEDQVAVIAINEDEADSQDEVRSYLEQRNLSALEVWLDDGRAAALFGATTLPMLVVIDPRGRISDLKEGTTSFVELRKMVERAGGGEGEVGR